MWVFPVRRSRFEELSFPINLLVSFSTSDLEEFSVRKFSRLFFHLAPDEIHPLVLLIPVALLFYCVFASLLLFEVCVA